MKKAHKKFKVKTMRRCSRIFANDLNSGKSDQIIDFLHQWHNYMQYFIDLFWQRKDFSAELADIDTVHRACKLFNITTRMAQATAKQAKEIIRSQIKKNDDGTKLRKPRLRNHTAYLCQHFVRIESFDGSFEYAIKLGGAGVPELVIPLHSTKHLNDKIEAGWKIGNSIKIGIKNNRIFIDLMLEKPKPEYRKEGKVIGLDSNYKNGLVTSDGAMTGTEVYEKINTFEKRQKNTYKEARDLTNKAIKNLNLSDVKMLVIEDLKNVHCGSRGKFPHTLNRRLSHWLYNSIAERLQQRCEELGIRLERKSPWKTSQRCAVCGKWDKRNRSGDKFHCIFCGHSDHADLNAAKNLAALGLAGTYGIRSLQSPA